MPVAEFSEAQFQFDLVSEPTRRNRRQRSGTFHPTTNLEAGLGYDGALYSDYLVRLLGVSRRCGAHLPTGNWHVPQAGESCREPLAPIWTSIFLQMKRPVFIVGWERSVSASMGCPHYRVDLDCNQVWRSAELELSTRRHRYAYKDPTTLGKVFSEPESVTPEPLTLSLERMLSKSEPRCLSHYMVDLHDAVVRAVPPYRHDMLTLAKQATDRVVERLRDWLSGDADYRWLPENGESVFDVIWA